MSKAKRRQALSPEKREEQLIAALARTARDTHRYHELTHTLFVHRVAELAVSESHEFWNQPRFAAAAADEEIRRESTIEARRIWARMTKAERLAATGYIKPAN